MIFYCSTWFQDQVDSPQTQLHVFTGCSVILCLLCCSIRIYKRTRILSCLHMNLANTLAGLNRNRKENLPSSKPISDLLISNVLTHDSNMLLLLKLIYPLILLLILKLLSQGCPDKIANSSSDLILHHWCNHSSEIKLYSCLFRCIYG